MTQHKPTAYLPPSSPYREECRTCGLEWPCPAEIARRQRGPHSDPYAVRARTHRHDTAGLSCTRCGKPWPCPKADTTDPQPKRGRWFVPLLIAAVVAAAVGCSWYVGAW